ncbi:acyltransferase ChoActase/COT/CPT [Nadsonia fulvescens var. elongata DSM 6958]|uniref:Carnitine O-acetyltransferase, mitochondrial n=1 Tax=Nadsonia fulvescens var. elongata DSM 6958 TaxID=857566 RepID=A0A1E3PDL3_9ASCO|nr:acyltransferase ChoActase/COT/CPT [Nadsonia fulvescens var. elongata DSM 6958]
MAHQSLKSPIMLRQLSAARTLSSNATGAPAGYVQDLSQGPMLRYQASLPRLPVPTLEETAAKYLQSVKALATPEELQHTENALKEFLAPGGSGRALQAKLEAKAADPNTKNWMYEWWNDAAYLTYRDPVVPYVSYFYSHKDDRLRKDPAKRAAALTKAVLEFKQQVDNKTLEPDYMRKLPMCMDSFKWMFNTCRLPIAERDDSVAFDPKDHSFFVVVRKGRFYRVDHEVDGVELSASDLENQFKQIYQLADAESAGPGIGSLTSENRDKWVEFRANLIAADAHNGFALKTIEASSFVVCLDEQKPVTFEERAHQYWHGDGINRFYDKPLQFIICDNGTSGFMGEHSMMDGTPTHRINDYINEVITKNKIDLNKSSGLKQFYAPQEITFTTNSIVESNIATAQSDFSAVIDKHELAVWNYHGYGKGLMKQFKCSPDAYVQMLIQLAYFKMFGISRPTYESATTRKFQQGRTETCRSVSVDSVAFVKAMESEVTSNVDKVAAFRKAVAAHIKYISDASEGHGVDRHLFGLKKCLSQGESMPALFADPMFSYSSSWTLSTSQLSSEHFNGYGWSQVVDTGFGCAYMINENNININIVSKYQGSEKLKYYLQEAAEDLRRVLEEDAKALKAKL